MTDTSGVPQEDAHGVVLPVEPYNSEVVNYDELEDTAPLNGSGDIFYNASDAPDGEDQPEEVDPDIEWAFNRPDADLQLKIQQALARRGLYQGKQNGDWGPLSVYAIQESLDQVAPRGWFHKADAGVESAALCVYIQKLAEKYGAANEADQPGVLTQEDWEGYLIALEGKPVE